MSQPLAPPLDCRPVVIVGAPRSGTNMLRDVLTRLPGVETWPCDEINYIWRHGNARATTDELTPAEARPAVARYIRRQFNRIARQTGGGTIVEKTCANTLRIPFVDAVLPEARYVFLRRDGRDAVASALLRWRAKLEPRYLLSKARFVPPTDLPYYAGKYLLNRLHRLTSRERRLGMWGPRFAELPQALQSGSLAEACALQWQRCDGAAAAALEQIDPARVYRMQYERFVAAPAEELNRLLAELGIHSDAAPIAAAVTGVSPRSVGKWRAANLPDGVLQLLHAPAWAA